MSKKTLIIFAVAAGLIVLGYFGFFGTEITFFDTTQLGK